MKQRDIYKKTNTPIKYIYIEKSNNPINNYIITRELIFNKFLKKTINLFENFPIRSKYIEYLFGEHGLPSLENNDNFKCFKDGYNYVAIYTGKEPEFDHMIQKISEIKKNIISKQYDKITAYISEKNINENDNSDIILKIKLRDFTNREYHNYKSTDLEKICASLCYHNVLTYMIEGNQWAMDEKRVKHLMENNYNIELFGSTFNTRLKYFGCLYKEVDEPFGGLGEYDYILDKLIKKEPLMWRDTVIYDKNDIIKIQVNPPTVYILLRKLWDMIKELMSVRKAIIYLGYPNYMIDEIKSYKYSTYIDEATEFISYEHNRLIPFGKTEFGKTKLWFFFIISNV